MTLHRTDRRSLVRRPDPAGFTLLELMVTVAVAGVLLAVAAPALKNVITQRAVVAQSGELVEAMRFARSESMKRSLPVTVCKVATPGATTCSTTNSVTWQYWLVFAEFTGSGTIGTYDAGEIVLRRQTQNAGNATFAAANPANLNYITFYSTGIAQANAWGTTSTGSASKLSITIDPQMSGAGTSTYNRYVRQVCLNAQGRTEVVDGNSSCS